MSRTFHAALAAALLALFLAPSLARADEKGGPPKEPETPAPQTDEPVAPADEAAGEEAPKPDRTAEVRALVAELMPEVARLRGLEWKRPVPAFALPREKLSEHMLADLDTEYPADERERDDRVMHRLGLLAPDEKLLDLVLGMMRDMVAGFYDPKEGELYLIEGPVGEGMKPTLVHELTHALDDQHYDLDGMEEKHEDDPDRVFAGRCLFEGCAVRMQQLFEEENPKVAYESLEQTADDEGLAAGQMRVLEEVPAYLVVSTLLHYRVGPSLVGQMTRGGFADGMQKLWADPPTTQEHFLHPERWMDPSRRDLPRTITIPDNLAETLGEGWTRWYGHTLGELDFALNLDFFLGGRRGRLDPQSLGQGTFVDTRAHEAAMGWDGGKVVYFDHGGEKLVVLQALAFDSAKDAREAVEALTAVETLRGRTLPDLVESPDGLVFTVYENEHGKCAILQRDHEVYVLDGVPADRFDAFREAVLATQVVQAEGDHGDASSTSAPENPLEGCVLVNARRGLGMRKLPEGWSAMPINKGPVFAMARGPDGSVIQILIADQGMTKGALPYLLKMQVPGFDADKVVDGQVAGQGGCRYVISDVGRWVEMQLASDGLRTFIGVVMADPAHREEQGDAIQAVLDSIVSKASY